MASPLWKTHGETPPMLDLTVSSSAYGSSIPFGYGIVPVGANIIWSTDIVATPLTSNNITNYIYSCSFAAAAGEGPGAILKIWGDDLVLFDQTGLYVNYQGEWDSNRIYLVGAIVHYNSTGKYYELYKPYYGLPSPNPDITGYWYVYTGIVGATGQQVYASPMLYGGTDTQLVDATIEGDLGVGLTSAYRGLIYAVWTDLDLTAFNNKVPNIRMLVQFGTASASTTAEVTAIVSVVTGDGPGVVMFTCANDFAVGQTAIISGSSAFLNAQMRTGYVITACTSTSFSASTAVWGAPWHGTPGRGFGQNCPFDDTPVTDCQATVIPTAVPGEGPPVTASLDNIVQDICVRCGVPPAAIDVTDLAGIATTLQLGSADLPPLSIYTGSTMTFYQSHSGSGVGSPVQFNYPGDGRNRLLPPAVLVYPLAPTETMLINPYSDNEANILPGWTRTDGNTIIPFEVVGVLTGDLGPATWDETSTAPFNSAYQSDILTIWTAQLIVQTAGTYTLQCIHMGGVILGIPGATRVSGPMVNAYDSTMTKTPLKGYPILYQNNYNDGNYPGSIDPPTPGSLTDTFEISFSAAGTYLIELDYGCHIHDRCCNLVWQMLTGDYSALVPQPGTAGADPITSGSGYIVTNQKDGKSLINELQDAYFFNLTESDFQLKAVQQGAHGPVVNIPEMDLGLVKDDKAISEVIVQMQDQPQSVTTTYLDTAVDFTQQSQLKARSSRVVTSLQQVTVDLRMSMSSALARAIAEETLYTTWMNRQAYDFNLWKTYYCLLDATDVVEFVYEGITYQVRVVTSNIGQNWATELKSVSQLANAYASVVASGPSGGGVVTTLTSGPTTLFLFDSPYLADADATNDQAQTGIYWAVVSTDPTVNGWGGGICEQSLDGTNYNTIGSSVVGPSFGYVNSGALPVPRAFEVWDMVNTVDIVMTSGTLVSATDLDVYAGANSLLIGNEVVQFADCISTGANIYTISRLLRGRRNTDPFAVNHESNENVLVLGSGINHSTFPLSFINEPDLYKGVTIGADASLVAAQSLTSQANDSRCASPVHLKGSRDGSNDLQIGWIRRTRFGGEWLEGTGYVPLNEETEAYEVDIMHSDFFTLIRTIEWTPGQYDSNGLPYVVYTAAQQLADGLTLGNPVNVCVYQVSAITGRGFGAEATL